MEFSADGSLTLGIDGSQVRVWDAEKGNEIHRLQGQHDEVNCARVSVNNKRVITGGNGGHLVIWELEP